MSQQPAAYVFYGAKIEGPTDIDDYIINDFVKIIYSGFEDDDGIQRAIAVRDSVQSFDWQDFENLNVSKINIETEYRIKSWERDLQEIGEELGLNIGTCNWKVGVSYG